MSTGSTTGIQAEVPVASADCARAARRRFEVTQRFVPKLQGPVLDLGSATRWRALSSRTCAVEQTASTISTASASRAFGPAGATITTSRSWSTS